MLHATAALTPSSTLRVAGVGDVAGLDRMFQALNFTQKKADAEVSV